MGGEWDDGWWFGNDAWGIMVRNNSGGHRCRVRAYTAFTLKALVVCRAAGDKKSINKAH